MNKHHKAIAEIIKTEYEKFLAVKDTGSCFIIKLIAKRLADLFEKENNLKLDEELRLVILTQQHIKGFNKELAKRQIEERKREFREQFLKECRVKE